MFFECSDMQINIIHVFHIYLSKRNYAKSDPHHFHALSFRTKGDSDIQMEDGSSVHLETGDIAFIPANIVYTQSNQDEKLFVIHLVTSNEMPVQTIKKFTPKNPEYFEDLFKNIETAWLVKKPGYMYECKSKLYKILQKIEEECVRERIASASNRIFEVAEYIHENFADSSLTVEFLAKRYGMSTTYFRNQFCSLYRITPLKYINNLRFNYASELLSADYNTIEEISEKCGFNNINYFSAFIKKQTGMSPTSYRKQLLISPFEHINFKK